MKVGISSYSFHSYIAAGKITLMEVPAIAAEMGYEAIEFVDFEMPNQDTEAYAAELKKACDAAGLAVACYAVGGNMLVADQAKAVEAYKHHVDIAAILGAPVLRHDLMHGPCAELGIRTYEEAVRYAVPGIREVSDYAASKGIKTTTENHGQFSQDSIRVEKLVTEVAHPNFGLLVDIGNFMCADEPSVLAVGRVAPLAFHVHCKDFLYKEGAPISGQGWFQTRGGNSLRGTILGHGVVPVAQCLGILKRAGYDGFVSLEFEGVEDCMTAAKYACETLKSITANL